MARQQKHQTEGNKPKRREKKLIRSTRSEWDKIGKFEPNLSQIFPETQTITNGLSKEPMLTQIGE